MRIEGEQFVTLQFFACKVKTQNKIMHSPSFKETFNWNWIFICIYIKKQQVRKRLSSKKSDRSSQKLDTNKSENSFETCLMEMSIKTHFVHLEQCECSGQRMTKKNNALRKLPSSQIHSYSAFFARIATKVSMQQQQKKEQKKNNNGTIWMADCYLMKT